MNSPAAGRAGVRLCAVFTLLVALNLVCFLYSLTWPAQNIYFLASLNTGGWNLRSAVLSKYASFNQQSASVYSQQGPPKLHPWVRVYDSHQPTNETFECVPLGAMYGNPTICIHPVEADIWVSGAIKNYGLFEKPESDLMQNILQQNPTMNVVDLGANLGQYSLLAANMGRKALAVDPMLENVRRIHRSAQLNGVQDNITVIMNGVSEDHSVLKFAWKDRNVGGTSLYKIQGKSMDENEYGITQTRSVLLDDLVPLCHNQTLFIKMDVEGGEVKAIRGGKKFFLQNDVRYVMMEANYHTNNPDRHHLIDFFISYGLEPRTIEMTKLDVANFSAWGVVNMIWTKQSIILR